MKKLIFFFSVMLSMTTIKAQEGFQYAVTGNGVDYYYRIENDIMGISKQIWLKYDRPSKKVKTKSGKYVTKGGGFTMAYMEIGCSSKTHQTNNIINYDNNGNPTERDDTPTFSKPIVPGSVIEGVYNAVCRKE
ncbi:MAG: hypothetical protein K0M63_07310 [Weeksellaceae bacterium]|nr:hypothetical protein [Weeksellaceae bacterium]